MGSYVWADCPLGKGTWRSGWSRAKIQPMLHTHHAMGGGTFFWFSVARSSPGDPRRAWGRKTWTWALNPAKWDMGSPWYYKVAWSVLIVCRFCIWEFAYSLKFTGNPRNSPCGTFVIICRHAQSNEKFELPDVHLRLNKMFCLLVSALMI